MIATFTDYNAKVDKWVTIREVHASIQAARIRAKVKGWSLINVKANISPSNRLPATPA